jgi:membrane protein YdbS with pleckstrin-like domain
MDEWIFEDAPQGFTFKAAINFKKGRFAVASGLIILAALIAAIVSALFIFYYDISTPEGIFNVFVRFSLFVAILALFVLSNCLTRFIVYKKAGCGHVKLHLGIMRWDISFQNAITRNMYMLAQLLSSFIPVVITGIVAAFVWSDTSDFMYASIFVMLFNAVALLPIVMHIFKYDKYCMLRFTEDTLYIYTEVPATFVPSLQDIHKNE